MSTPLNGLVEVRLLRLPVPIYARAQEHSDALMREFALIALELRSEDTHAVPARLTGLVQELTAVYSGLTGEQETILADAVAAGAAEISELVYRLPAEVAGASRHLGELLDEADRYCAEGRHLLTLATPPEAKRFRDWYLGEFVGQIEGRPALSWPEFASRA